MKCNGCQYCFTYKGIFCQKATISPTIIAMGERGKSVEKSFWKTDQPVYKII